MNWKVCVTVGEQTDTYKDIGYLQTVIMIIDGPIIFLYFERLYSFTVEYVRQTNDSR